MDLEHACAHVFVVVSSFFEWTVTLEVLDVLAAKFPTVKSLDSFDFVALPSLNKMLVLALARSDYIERREGIIALGNSGTGKSHIALGLGLAACQKGLSVGFITA